MIGTKLAFKNSEEKNRRIDMTILYKHEQFTDISRKEKSNIY
ncbi:hypothetical protein [Bacillus sp. UMB0893]|nr:hypothetical protein [Bacillus sp. UMB0893]